MNTQHLSDRPLTIQLISHTIKYSPMSYSQRQRLKDQASQDAPPPSTQIFGGDFAVVPLDNPKEYLSQYMKQQIQQPSTIQKLSTCCGDCLIGCAPCFGICGCPCCCVYELQTAKAGLVEVFGSFDRMLKPGINMINPCSQEVREVELRIIGLPVGRHPTITKDQVKVDVDASISYRVTNPIISYYKLGNNLNRALVELTISSLRDVIGTYNLDQLLLERFQVSVKAKEMVIAGMPPGIKVHNVFIDQLIIPYQTERDLTSAARQKRLSEAAIISNKADVESASLMKQSANLLDSKVAMQIRYLEMVKNLGEKNGVTVMMNIGVDKKGY